MKIYTRTGDDGKTGLLNGQRVLKDDLRMEACGTVDELNALLGVARSGSLAPDVDRCVDQIQHDLFALGAELATLDPAASGTQMIGARSIAFLEQAIDHFDPSLRPLREFILPAGTSQAAALHLARTICRRAERRVVSLTQQPGDKQISPHLVIYLNRVSDLLFVLARVENHRASCDETPWKKPEME